MTQREDFEAWKKINNALGYGLSRNNAPDSNLDGYEDAYTQGQWVAWRAAQPALQADVVRLNMALHGYQVAIETTEESLKDRVALAMEVERLKAAGAVDCGHRPPCTECSDYAAPIPQQPAEQAQPERAPLSDDEIQTIYLRTYNEGFHGRSLEIAFARAIEAAIKQGGQHD